MVKVVIEFLNPEANRKAKMMRRELIKAIDEAIEKIEWLGFTVEDYAVNMVPG